MGIGYSPISSSLPFPGDRFYFIVRNNGDRLTFNTIFEKSKYILENSLSVER
ncbi:MAG: hypothetical protein RMX65_036275 [Nostoc sp. DedQUE01]